MDNVQAYDAQADSIKVEDIATNDNNRIVLRRMKRNEPCFTLWIQNHHDDEGEDCVDYCPEGPKDMGWLGYFVGKNEHLRELYIRDFEATSGESVMNVIEPFFRGVSSNKSIRKVDICGGDLLGGKVFTMLGPFFKNNSNLSSLSVNECNFGEGECRSLALAIGSMTNKSLQAVELRDNDIADHNMVDIIVALSMHPNLQYLSLAGNHLSIKGCLALATLLQCSATELKELSILDNQMIDDEGIEALVSALKNTALEHVVIGSNLITTRGWKSLATVLGCPNSNLTVLIISDFNLEDDQVVAAFTKALVNNHTLRTLSLRGPKTITANGWKSFSNMLCDTSSVNSTFMSNHALLHVNTAANTSVSEIIEPLLGMNRGANKKDVAMIKILRHHEEFDMQPFFEWEFKVLPMILDWFERASACEMPAGFDAKLGERRLSCIYQFVKGLPLLYVEASLKKQLEDIKAKEKQMEEEQLQMEKAKLALQREELMLRLQMQEFSQRKKSVEDHKISIMRKLGQKLS